VKRSGISGKNLGISRNALAIEEFPELPKQVLSFTKFSEFIGFLNP